jgi:hypothetical protein
MLKKLPDNFPVNLYLALIVMGHYGSFMGAMNVLPDEGRDYLRSLLKEGDDLETPEIKRSTQAMIDHLDRLDRPSQRKFTICTVDQDGRYSKTFITLTEGRETEELERHFSKVTIVDIVEGFAKSSEIIEDWDGAPDTLYRR